MKTVLSRPVFGEPRIDHATPATSGGANSGRMLAAAMKPLNGVLVRTTIQENNSPIATAIAVPPPQATSVLNSASADIRIGQHGEEIADRQPPQIEALDHRIGVGQRAEQQRQHGIDHEEAEDREQQRDPDLGQHAAACAFRAAPRDRDGLAQNLSGQRASPWPAAFDFIVMTALAETLCDRPIGWK